MTVDFTSGDRPLWYAWLSGARHRIGLRSHRWKPWHWQGKVLTHGFLPPDGSRHEVEKHLWLLEQAGIAAPKDKSLFLAVPPEAASWAEQTLRPYTGKKIILVHPVSRWLFKCWENERMAAVIDWLQQKKNCIVVVTSSAQERELERARQIVALCAHKPLFFEGTIRLEQLAALCSKADCFLGVDTAPMHIAAAVGTPVVALFGPSNAEHWGPWTPKQVSIHKMCPCRAEGGQRCDWSKVRDCMRSIRVEDVQQALEKWV
jgi:heptosyltransferase-3